MILVDWHLYGNRFVKRWWNCLKLDSNGFFVNIRQFNFCSSSWLSNILHSMHWLDLTQIRLLYGTKTFILFGILVFIVVLAATISLLVKWIFAEWSIVVIDTWIASWLWYISYLIKWSLLRVICSNFLLVNPTLGTWSWACKIESIFIWRRTRTGFWWLELAVKIMIVICIIHILSWIVKMWSIQNWFKPCRQIKYSTSSLRHYDSRIVDNCPSLTHRNSWSGFSCMFDWVFCSHRSNILLPWVSHRLIGLWIEFPIERQLSKILSMAHLNFFIERTIWSLLANRSWY